MVAVLESVIEGVGKKESRGYSSWRGMVSQERAEILESQYLSERDRFYIVSTLSEDQMRVIDQTDGFGSKDYLLLARIEREMKKRPAEVEEWDKTIKPTSAADYGRVIAPLVETERRLVAFRLGTMYSRPPTDNEVNDELRKDYEINRNRLRFKMIAFKRREEIFEEYHSSHGHTFSFEAYDLGVKMLRKMPTHDRHTALSLIDSILVDSPQEVRDAHIVFSKMCVATEKKHRFDRVYHSEMDKGNFAIALERARVRSDRAVMGMVRSPKKRLSQLNNVLFYMLITNESFDIPELQAHIPNIDSLRSMLRYTPSSN